MLLFSCSFLAAAEEDIASLLKQADDEKTKNPTEFVSILNQLETEQEHFRENEKHLYTYLKGFRAGFSGQPNQALSLYDQVINDSSDLSLKARAMSAKINIYAITRNIADGYKEIQRLIPIIDQISPKIRTETYVVLSIFYNQVGDYEAALESANRVLDTSTSERTRCFAGTTKNEALVNLGRQLPDSHSFDSTITVCENIEEAIPVGFNILHKANYLIAMQQDDLALAMLEKARPLFERTQYPVSMSAYHAKMAILQITQQDNESAKAHAQRALELAKTNQLSKPRIEATSALSLYYEHIGELDKALELTRESAAIEKAYLDEIKVKQLAIQKSRIETLQNESQIKLLDKENALLKAQAALNREQQDYNKLVIIGLSFLVIIGVVWLLYSRNMNQKLRKLAHIDSLTQIPNRHYFTQLGTAAMEYHKKLSHPVAFVIFDLDLFKSVNDRFGHSVGDWALRTAVREVKRISRKQDIVGRLGGEEFALILPGCNIEHAVKVAENCRRAIANIDTSETGYSFTITASFGVSDSNRCGYQFDQLYACSDSALYMSKDHGRNCVYAFEADPVFTGDAPA